MIARRRRTNSGSSDKRQERNGHTQRSGSTFVSSTPPPQPVAAEMSCRDRSNEFMSAVKLLQSRQVNTAKAALETTCLSLLV